MAKVVLKPCCRTVLEDMRHQMRIGELLEPALIVGQLVVIMAGRGRSAQVPTAINVKTTDWSLFARAVGAVNPMVKAAVRQNAALHRLRHSGGTLGKFWRDMYNSLA